MLKKPSQTEVRATSGAQMMILCVAQAPDKPNQARAAISLSGW
jgi:hypothetical protein